MRSHTTPLSVPVSSLIFLFPLPIFHILRLFQSKISTRPVQYENRFFLRNIFMGNLTILQLHNECPIRPAGSVCKTSHPYAVFPTASPAISGSLHLEDIEMQDTSFSLLSFCNIPIVHLIKRKIHTSTPDVCDTKPEHNYLLSRSRSVHSSHTAFHLPASVSRAVTPSLSREARCSRIQNAMYIPLMQYIQRLPELRCLKPADHSPATTPGLSLHRELSPMLRSPHTFSLFRYHSAFHARLSVISAAS